MIKFIKSMSWFIKKNWYRYVLVVFFGLFLACLNILPAKIIGVVTKAIDYGNLTYDILIYKALLPFLGVMVSIYLVATTKRFCQNRLTTTLYYALHQRYMDSILNQDATFFEKFQAGDLLSRALGDINTVKFSGGNRLLNIFVEFMSVVITFVVMLLIHPILAICCFLPLLLIFFANFKLRALVKRNWKLVREKHSDMSNAILESVTNVKTIRAFNITEESTNRNLVESSEAYRVEKQNLKINVIFQPMFEAIVAISMIICYSLGAYFYKLGQVEVHELIEFVMYLTLFQQPLTAIGNMLNNFYQSLISADRLNEVYNSKSSIHQGKLEVVEIDSIEFKDFEFKYNDDPFNSINSLSLKINKGETLGIVGHTGSGKSTLVKMLLRQMPTNDKSIYINGKPIEEYDLASIRRKMSYVPQEHTLFSRSVYNNVLLGNIEADEDMVMNAIRLADFERDIEFLADGLDTIVGEYGVTLSGGQKQRLSIARAFLRNSDVMILDDSLSAVDGKTESNIISSLKRYRKNKTNIIVAHRMSAVMHADNIVVFDEGRIIESGNHEELMSKKGWYYTMFTSQMMEVDHE